MATYSNLFAGDASLAVGYVDPNTINNISLQNGVAVDAKQADLYQLSQGDAVLDIYGSDLAYSGNLITGGTITGNSLDIGGSRVYTLSGLSLTVDQINSAQSDLTQLSALVFGGDDNVQFNLTQTINDSFSAGNGNDTVQTGPGNDTISGNQGNDLILAGPGDDVLYGGQGNDTIRAGMGDDMVLGDKGADLVLGDLGNDTVYGGMGADSVYGGKGDDILIGGKGDDLLVGGQGADTFRFTQGDGADVVADFSKADGDKIDLQGLSYTVGQSADGSALLNVFGGGTIELTGVAAGNVDASYFSG